MTTHSQAIHKIDTAVLEAAKIDQHTELATWILRHMDSDSNQSILQIAIDRKETEVARSIAHYMTANEIGKREFATQVRLEKAIVSNHIDLVEALIKLGAKIDKLAIENQPALHYSVIKGTCGMVQCLVKYTKDINRQNLEGHTPLHVAIDRGYDTMMSLLRCKGINVNAQNNEGNTPLHVAVKFEYFLDMSILIRNRANLNIQNNEGETPLHYLCKLRPSKWEEKCNMMQTFLSLGADGTIKNNDGLRPFDL